MSESALEIVISLGSGVAALGAYSFGVARYRRLRRRTWPVMRTVWFALGVAIGVGALAPPLDAASDARFAPHMLQHLMLMDLTAPLIVLGAPLWLVLSVAPNSVTRRIAAFLQGPGGHVLMFPVFTWGVFVLSMWLLHFTGFFQAALGHEPLHVLEHAIFVSTALLFWFPIITAGPSPWSRGPLAYPIRMLYLLFAMPAGALLGFSLYGARHVLYAHYAAAGLADQQNAGEGMWIGNSLVMFVAFMLVGLEWAKHEERLGERLDAG